MKINSSISQPSRVLLGVALLYAGLAWSTSGFTHAVEAPAQPDNTEDTQRRIVLDPDTGKAIEPQPGAVDQAHAPAARRRAGKKQQQAAQPWKTADGVQMLKPAPADAPQQRAVVCPDASVPIVRGANPEPRSARCEMSND